MIDKKLTPYSHLQYLVKWCDVMWGGGYHIPFTYECTAITDQHKA